MERRRFIKEKLNEPPHKTIQFFMKGDAMPWKGLGNMTDDELSIIWLYLQAQPEFPTNEH